MPNPQSQSFSQSYGPTLPTSLCSIDQGLQTLSLQFSSFLRPHHWRVTDLRLTISDHIGFWASRCNCSRFLRASLKSQNCDASIMKGSGCHGVPSNVLGTGSNLETRLVLSRSLPRAVNHPPLQIGAGWSPTFWTRVRAIARIRAKMGADGSNLGCFWSRIQVARG